MDAPERLTRRRGAAAGLAWVIAALLWSPSAAAQELTPRAYWPAPKGIKVAIVGYSHVNGDVLFDPSIPLYGVDSDGFIGELIPLWMEAGVNFCDPIEVAAHNDINDFRKRFGRQMAYRGGVDKRAIAAGGQVIEDEIARITPVIDDGGFIPSCDHGVPADISWDNFVNYVKLLAKRTGWL